MPTPPIFLEWARKSTQLRAAQASRAAFETAFITQQAACDYLFQIILPPSLRWGFISVGKNATSSVLHHLFQIEFGHPMTTQVQPDHDINPAASIHMLVDHGVFSRALWQGISASDLLGADGPQTRICVLRDPMARAVSGFRYLCRSHRAQSQWFARDRFRMNAVVGFDWNTHPDTEDGFERFLQYLEWQIDAEGADRLDAHWKPQNTFIKPDVFQPTLMGRMEDMPAFFKTLNDTLGVPPAQNPPWENKRATAADALMSYAPARLRVRDIYAQDYAAFGY